MAHRALLQGLGIDHAATPAAELDELGVHTSALEREAMQIERKADDVCLAFLLERRLAEAGHGEQPTFEGEVVGLIEKGAFVRFGDAGFEGFMGVRRMREWWTLNEFGTALVTESSRPRAAPRRPDRGDRGARGRAARAGGSSAYSRRVIRFCAACLGALVLAAPASAEPVSEKVSSGVVTAEFTYERDGKDYSDFHLKVERDGLDAGRQGRRPRLPGGALRGGALGHRGRSRTRCASATSTPTASRR